MYARNQSKTAYLIKNLVRVVNGNKRTGDTALGFEVQWENSDALLLEAETEEDKKAFIDGLVYAKSMYTPSMVAMIVSNPDSSQSNACFSQYQDIDNGISFQRSGGGRIW